MPNNKKSNTFTVPRTIQTRSTTSRGMGNTIARQNQTTASTSSRGRRPKANTQRANATSPPSPAQRTTKRQRVLSFDEKLQQWFDQYKDPEDEEGRIGHQGFEQWMNDLRVDMDSEYPLLLCWKLRVSTMGYVTKEEWISGFKKWGVESNEQLKMKLPELNNTLTSPDLFKDLYRYTFDYVKDKNQKCIDVEVAIYMWDQLFAKRPTPHVKEFSEYLKQAKQPKVLTRDQWTNFLEFVNTIDETLSNYDLESAWPCVFDEYAEWRKAKNDKTR
ncbi:13782_t:CDS:2 [Ambispora leptoticha]|uniref:Defective in cullin neddylation protein n=1 Tax=Ambispora leptoticha TaxID=144679 RepID=A0A9N9F2T2_9GLOM|nr:13782_t:CDS:2 [Ambispora leptoticha]